MAALNGEDSDARDSNDTVDSTDKSAILSNIARTGCAHVFHRAFAFDKDRRPLAQELTPH